MFESFILNVKWLGVRMVNGREMIHTIFLGKPARKMLLRIRRRRWWGNNKVTKLR
jgi:hypothetical protein